MEHTKLPWDLGGDGADIFGPGTAPSLSDSHHVADCQPTSPGLLGMGVTDVHNAQFIVKACNSHYELLEALEKAITLIATMNGFMSYAEDSTMARVIQAANEAIEKAEQ